jgi:preprotein translocase subunit SecG
MHSLSRTLCVLFFVAIPLLIQKKQSIGLSRSISSGIAQDEALSLTDALRSELGKRVTIRSLNGPQWRRS